MRLCAIFIILLVVCRPVARGHGSHDDRVAHFIKVLKNDPADVNARHDLARAYVEHGDWELALTELDRADAMIPPDSDLDFSLTRARALVIGERAAEARQVLDSFLTKSPGHSVALLERARVLDLLKMPDLSLADYRMTLEITMNPEPDLFIEVADHLVKQHLNGEAISVMCKSIETKGQVPSLVLKVMELEMAAGLYDDALKRVDTMAALMPRPEPWMAKRATVLAQAGRIDESKLVWRALLTHIDSLPDLERGSVAMTNLTTQARLALASLESSHPPDP